MDPYAVIGPKLTHKLKPTYFLRYSSRYHTPSTPHLHVAWPPRGDRPVDLLIHVGRTCSPIFSSLVFSAFCIIRLSLLPRKTSNQQQRRSWTIITLDSTVGPISRIHLPSPRPSSTLFLTSCWLEPSKTLNDYISTYQPASLPMYLRHLPFALLTFTFTPYYTTGQ